MLTKSLLRESAIARDRDCLIIYVTQLNQNIIKTMGDRRWIHFTSTDDLISSS